MQNVRLSFPLWVLLFLLLWVLTLITLPIVGWTLGETSLHKGMSFGVLMQFGAVLAALQSRWGWKRTAQVSGTVMALAFCAEWLGATTGFPFGKYHYTSLLQPQLAGVPLLIPCAWMMMLPPAWAVAQTIVGEEGQPFSWQGILLSALAFTAWDLFLDPQMTAWGFWVWETPGAYFGIPVVNFLGWILVSALITAVVRPNNLPILPLLTVYIVTWSLQSIGLGIFWSQPLPALAGFSAMGIFVLFALRRWHLPKRQSERSLSGGDGGQGSANAFSDTLNPVSLLPDAAEESLEGSDNPLTTRSKRTSPISRGSQSTHGPLSG